MITEIVFAAGRFWGVEKHFEKMDGVIDVVSGYTGGNYENPTYQDVLKYRKKSTDNLYCKEYEIFKNTPDGVFVDKLSGDVLFDTKDRFNSKTGWLSFYKAVDGLTVQLDDYSYGMKRVEVKAKTSGIHLGHVFPHKNAKKRFCINATVLDFIPRAK